MRHMVIHMTNSYRKPHTYTYILNGHEFTIQYYVPTDRRFPPVASLTFVDRGTGFAPLPDEYDSIRNALDLYCLNDAYAGLSIQEFLHKVFDGGQFRT